jgi:hypothetical protein
MNNVRLVCGGVSVDLPSDFGILINKSIADIREPESRSSDWSKTFTLPGTKANNKLFTHLFDLNLSIRNTSATNFNPDFNPNLKADAILQVDEVTQIQGFIRLLGIKVNDLNQIEYECSMHGELADLFAKVADAKLADLDFTAYNHIISDTNIFNSWDTSIVKNGSSGYVNFSGGAPIGEGYVYGWIDNGQYADYHTLYTDNMTPYLYAKTVVDAIFSGTGYSYSSGSFFNTAQFKRLVVPCPTKTPILSEQNILDRQFQAKFSGSVTFGNTSTQMLFPTEILDPSNQWNTGTSEFTNGFYSQGYDFTIYLDGSATGLTATAGAQDTLWFRLFVNGVVVQEKGVWTTNTAAGTATINDYVRFQNIKLQKNDEVVVHWYGARQGGIGAFISGAQVTLTANTSFYNFVVESSYAYDDTMDFGGFFTGVETKQREFMRWIFTMFNLYVEATEIDKQLVILPREDFYTTTVRDWTKKRDLLQPLEITPMGELDAGRYLFTYKDGEDEGNKYYKEDYSRTYGDRQILVQNDFVKDEKKIEIGFVPTIIVKPEQETDKYLPEIATNDGKTKSGDLRILQYKAKTCAGYLVRNGSWSFNPPAGTVKTKYPYMGHLDDPLTSSTDINFGMPRFIGLPPGTAVTNNNLFNAYWSKYLQEITDKDSKIVKGAFYLTPADMEKLSFRDLYFFDGNYFRLNKIEDYDPVNPSVNICEFLFLKSGVTFSATTGSVGGGGTQSGGGGQTEYDPEGGGTSNKVINQRGFNIGQFNQAGDGVIVGDAVSNYGRANAAFATSGTTFLPDSERSIVIGEGVQNVGSDEVWLQGHLMTQNNFSTNRIVNVVDNYTPSLYDDILICTLTTNSVISLPQASTAANKAYYIFKNTSAHSLTIDAYGDELIDDSATYALATHHECVQIVCDGSNWYVISKK